MKVAAAKLIKKLTNRFRTHATLALRFFEWVIGPGRLLQKCFTMGKENSGIISLRSAFGTYSGSSLPIATPCE